MHTKKELFYLVRRYWKSALLFWKGLLVWYL